MSTAPEPTTSIPDDWSLDEWIESGTVARRQVTIYNDHEAANRLATVDQALAAAGWTDTPTDGDGPLDAAPDPKIPALLTERDALVDRIVASGAVWTVRALSSDDVKATFEHVPEPKTPVPPLEKAGQKAQERFAQDVATYRRRSNEAKDERNLHLLAAAVVSIETPRGTAHSVSVEQLRGLRSRPHGAQAFERLFDAMNEATNDDVDVPRPTSREDSTSTPASSSR